MPRIASPQPEALTRANEVFERWRSRRKTRNIPNWLWRRAAELARRYGVNRTSRVLRLNYSEVKSRAEVLGKEERRPLTAGASFVELAPVNSGTAECVVEFERPDGGKMRLQFKGASAPDLAGLSRAFWGTPE